MAKLFVQLTQEHGLVLENMTENGAQNLANWAPGLNCLVVGDKGVVLDEGGQETIWPDPEVLGGTLSTPTVTRKDMRGTSYGQSV